MELLTNWAAGRLATLVGKLLTNWEEEDFLSRESQRKDPRNLYQRLLYLLPSGFVDEFGEEIIFVFYEQCREAYDTNGWCGVTKVTFLETLSFITSFGAEWATEGRERLATVSTDGFEVTKGFVDAVRNNIGDLGVVGLIVIVGFVGGLVGGGLVGGLVGGGVGVSLVVVVGVGGDGIASIATSIVRDKIKKRKENN